MSGVQQWYPADAELGSPEAVEVAAALMDQLAGTLNGMDDLPDYLDRVCHGVKQSVTGCDAAGVTLMVDDRFRTAAYTTATTLQIDAIQYAIGDGPCLDAYRNRRENLLDLSVAEQRWPAFGIAAKDSDIKTIFAVPLISGDRAFGALNLYGCAVDAFSDIDVTLVRMAASRAADALASVLHLVGMRELVGQMEAALASRAVIEQAKGIIIGRHGVDEDSAFGILAQQSQHTNVKLHNIAAEMVAAAVKGEPSP